MKLMFFAGRAGEEQRRGRELVDQGVDPTGGGPVEYDRVIRAEMGKRAKIIKQAGIKID